MKKFVIVLIVFAIAIGGVGIWYFSNSGDSLDVSTESIDKSNTKDSIKEQETPDGEWVVKTQDDVFVGYEIQELFGGDTIKKTAIAETKSISGSLSIEASSITSAQIEADLTQLKSDSSRRDSTQENSGLETNDFPTATFAIDSPTEIGEFTKNEEISLKLTGQVTLHGVTKTETFSLKATWDGKVIVVSGELEIVLSDYEIEPPKNSFVQVDDTGIIKLQLLFVPDN